MDGISLFLVFADDGVVRALDALFGRRRYRDPAARVLFFHAGARDGAAGRAAGGRPVPVLRVLGADADPDVLPDRNLGARAQILRRLQVHPVHHARLDPDAGRDPVPGKCRARAAWPSDLRFAGALRCRTQPSRSYLAVRRLCARLCDQGSDVAGAYVAARRAYRGTHGGLGHPGRRDAQDRERTVFCASRFRLSERSRSRRRRYSWPSRWSESSTARWSRWCSRT